MSRSIRPPADQGKRAHPELSPVRFDLPYILTHPLLARIVQHCARLEEQVGAWAEGSEEGKAIKRRIGKLQEYGLPKSDAVEQQTESSLNQEGHKIGERHSLRRRYVTKRRGRPVHWRLQVRAAFEEHLSNPRMTWAALAEKYGFKPTWRKSEDGQEKTGPGKD